MKNLKKSKKYFAFNKYKTISEWSKDIRCKVKYDVLYRRIINRKWNIEKAVTAIQLSGGTRINLIGSKFGLLTVISYKQSHKRHAIWNCECDCGNKLCTSTGCLQSGNVRSCGCFRKYVTGRMAKQRTLGEGKAAANFILNGYKRRAKQSNLDWQLSNKVFFELISKSCYYCGAYPTLRSKPNKSYNGACLANGIDRVDCNKGYILKNCVPCCKHCNYAKRALNQSEFFALIRNIYLLHKVEIESGYKVIYV